MQFTSGWFCLFFLAVFFVHWVLPARWRWTVCLVGSVGFYACFGLPMLAMLGLCIAVSYALGRFAGARQGNRAVLAVTLCVALAPLLTYKYFDSLAGLLGMETTVSLLTPVGISFFTFKIVAYLVECWRGTLRAQTPFFKYALYVSFFPQITSGPIQRPDSLLAQIDAPQSFDTARAIQSAQLILWGLFQKLVLADNIGGYVYNGFSRPYAVVGGSIMISAVLYSLQLYFDFAGYSNIANGCMGLLGYESPENFKSPYMAQSIREFWARWHMTLSSFLRDYVYFPLGGSRCSTTRTCINLMLTFLISGLWHGTGLQFLVWGALHGIYQVTGRLTQPLRDRAWRLAHISQQSVFARVVKTGITFVLVTIAWVFFGAQSFSDALVLFSRMPDSFSLSLQNLKNSLTMLGMTPLVCLRLGACLLLATVVDYLARDVGFSAWLSARRRAAQTVFCYVLLFTLIFLAPASGGGFIYFQF